MKVIGMILLVVLVIVAGVVWFFRYDIFQQSAEPLIKKHLPPYITVERILFDLKKGTMEVKELGIKNPPGYKDRYLATVSSILCRYRKKGDNILDGLEVTDITAAGISINIERLRDGRFNVNEMGSVMASGTEKRPGPATGPRRKGASAGKRSGGISISDIIKLTDVVNIKDGRIVFTDKAVRSSPYVLDFGDVSGKLVLDLTPDYNGVNSLSSRGGGIINGDRSQKVDWVISLDPRKKLLTMSNRYKVGDVDITLFEPYYDKYSPIIIKRGYFSGTLVFDFNNGNIGSTNTVRLSGLVFEEKKSGMYGRFWSVMGSDLIKYLQSARGDIIFDFKIKGSMENPEFYPGPIVERAMKEMAIDKFADMIKGPQEQGPEGQQVQGTGEKDDVDKVVDVLKGLLNN